MAFFEEDLKYLRERRTRGNSMMWAIILVLLILCGAIVFMYGNAPQTIRRAELTIARPAATAVKMDRNAPQTIRHAERTATRPAVVAAKADATRILNELRELQSRREDSIQRLETLARTLKESSASRSVTSVAAAAKPQPRQIRPTREREEKILTRADMEAEIARRNEQNARDKAEADRMDKKRRDEKVEQVLLNILQESVRKSNHSPYTRIVRTGRIVTHIRRDRPNP